MSYIVVDCESDGPIPNKYSMICFGAVVLDRKLDKTFYGKTKPISDTYDEKTLAISGISRKEHMSFDNPVKTMEEFDIWIKEKSKGKPIFISDNPAYDWQWINYYFHFFLGRNPFGYSARRIGDLYCGLTKNVFAKWKNLRDAPHNHNPVSDALGNAQALLKMIDMGLNIKID